MIIDNKKSGKVGEILKENISKGSKLSIISGYFTIYGFKELKKELEKIDSLKLLFNQSIFRNDSKESNLIFGETAEFKYKNSLEQTKIAKECANWIKTKVEIQEVNHQGTVPFNLYHIQNDNNTFALNGSSHFSSVGLGYTNSKSYHMNVASQGKENTQDFLNTFNDIWNDNTLVSNIKKEVLEKIEELYENKAPEFLYFLTLYNIFKDFIGELDEENIIKVKTGFKDTLVWNKLYNFQKDGVLGTIDKLERHNGCIIADSVGLGKTFEALAVIKYYELRNDRVLVLCPKKLRDNWTLYTINDKRNILSDDRFNYDVLNHTDLTRPKGMSGNIDLATLNWSNYDLIVIDESHNFRNTSTNKSKFKSRYSFLLEDILQKGVKTKVLMLSATPVNNRLNDLKNQVAFITENKDNVFKDFGIPSIENTLRIAQSRFNKWLELPDDKKTTENLLDSLNFNYFKLLDLVTIARSRKHIEKYYDTANIGKFPNRNKPKNIKSDIDVDDNFPPLSEINKTIRKLNLSAYSPLKYVYPSKQEEYSAKYDIQTHSGSVFKQIDRENSLIHLMRVNLLKRMESSINSFTLTIEKLLDNNKNLINIIDNYEQEYIEDMSIEDIDIDDENFTEQLIGNKVKVLIQDIDKIKWRQDLQSDIDKLEAIYQESIQISPSRDKKLLTLKENILQKIQNPINENNKKVIIFTAFADTANYLYENLAKYFKDDHTINSCLITGSGNNKTTMQIRDKDLNSLLTNFSPISKDRAKTNPQQNDEIDLLIATDCISEGQNLQDCDYLINYDIHWNPVRIIQRFGRVDRLGSKNSNIQLVNFWPNMELDEYINLEARVSGRMVLLDVSATGEENIIDTSNKEMNDLNYRAKQLKELQEQVIDLEDVSGSISITDLTLNDFRMDLMQFLKTNAQKLENSPLGLHSVVINDNQDLLEKFGKGVIFCLKLLTQNIPTDNYSLEPYYLVFVDENNEIKLTYSNAKIILDIYRKLCSNKKEVISEAISKLEDETNNYSEMSNYTSKLKVAIESIIGKKEESSMDSLFSRGATIITADNLTSFEDFELVSYLVIK